MLTRRRLYRSQFGLPSAHKPRRTRILASEQLEPRWALSNVPLGPLAIDDSFATNEDAAVSANVLSGAGADVPAKAGQTIRVAEVNGQTIGGGGAVVLESGASLQIATNGTFTYDPTLAINLQALDDGQHSQDQFTYIAAPQFSNVYVFGDSLSDQGQLFAVTGGTLPPDPPYFQGRFSNGPVWIEGVAPRLGLTVSLANNFAVGGATTGTANYNEATIGADLPGVTDELNAYLQHTGGQADPEALYVVWAGSNDFFLPFTDPGPVITQAVGNIISIVGTLEAIGAEHVLVLNMPDLGLTPYGLSIPGLGPQLTALTQAFNGALFASLDAYGLTTTQIDVYSRLQQVIADPAAFGLTNVTTAAFNGTAVVADPATSLFWDSVHPTAAGHALIADLIFDELSDEAVATIEVSGITTTPVLQATNLLDGAAGHLRLQLSATDAAVNDLAAGLQYLVDWGDGTPPVTATSAAVELTHSFEPGAVARITIEVVDQDGDRAVLREAVVWGTTQSDYISLQNGRQAETQIWRNGTMLASLATNSLDRFVAFGLAGNDLLAAFDSAIAVEFDGGSGADMLLGGRGDDILRGGADNDVLFGRQGDDLLIGGSGIDLLLGGEGDNVLYGSSIRKRISSASSLLRTR